MENRSAVRLLPVLLSLLVSPACLTAQGRAVTFPSGSETASRLLFQPGGGATHAKQTDRHPGLIVTQEWWGLNDWIKQQAQGFADQGYVTLAVD